MLRSYSAEQDAFWSGTEREGASRGVEGGGNERPLVAGMDAQRNLAWMPGLLLTHNHEIPATTLVDRQAGISIDYSSFWVYVWFMRSSQHQRLLAPCPGSFIFMRRAAHSIRRSWDELLGL